MRKGLGTTLIACAIMSGAGCGGGSSKPPEPTRKDHLPRRHGGSSGTAVSTTTEA